MEFFVVVILVLVALNLFFFLILRGIAARLARFAQINVLRQSGIYDDLIRKKQEQLTAINNQIVKAEVQKSEQKKSKVSGSKEKSDLLEIRQGAYTDANFASEYRAIRDNFQIDAIDTVRRQVAAIPETQGSVNAAMTILNELSLQSAYELSTLSSADQLEILEDMFNDEQVELIRMFMEQVEEFHSYRFIFWLKDYVFANGEDIVVYTSGEADDFNAIDKRIVTKRDESICEGFYILSKGLKYDYSIRNREIVG